MARPAARPFSTISSVLSLTFNRCQMQPVLSLHSHSRSPGCSTALLHPQHLSNTPMSSSTRPGGTSPLPGSSREITAIFVIPLRGLFKNLSCQRNPFQSGLGLSSNDCCTFPQTLCTTGQVTAVVQQDQPLHSPTAMPSPAPVLAQPPQCRPGTAALSLTQAREEEQEALTGKTPGPSFSICLEISFSKPRQGNTTF